MAEKKIATGLGNDQFVDLAAKLQKLELGFNDLNNVLHDTGEEASVMFDDMREIRQELVGAFNLIKTETIKPVVKLELTKRQLNVTIAGCEYWVVVRTDEISRLSEIVVTGDDGATDISNNSKLGREIIQAVEIFDDEEV